jgi:hypothetical protein
VRNELNAIPDNGNLDIMSPFLTVHGEVDKEVYQRYKAIIDQAIKRIYFLIAAFKNPSKTHSTKAE